MRCWECPDEVRYRRGCTMGFRQGLGYEGKEALPVSCPVLLAEPAGFWAAMRLHKWIERGSPTITLEQVTHSQLELAELVQHEVHEGEKNYVDRREKANARLAELASKMKG
jgi:hypothetical protein